jgi:hypothetical protein
MEVSEEEEADDIVRFELPDCKIPALEIVDKNKKLMPDQFIMALGNSEGAGVIPCIKGRTGGIGIYWVEIDAPVTHGNSGGPVLLDGGKTVIGVVTKYEHTLGDHTTLPGSSSTGIRRLCIRPERVGKWRRVPVEQIVKEAETIKRIDTDTGILKSLIEFHLYYETGYQLFSAQYTKPKAYVMTDSELAANIAQHLKDLESGLKEDKTKFNAAKDYWFRATGVSGDARNQALAKELKAAQRKVRNHVALFADAMAALYEVGINDVAGKDYCPYDRKLYKESAKEREKVVDLLRKHFAEEVRQFDFDAS